MSVITAIRRGVKIADKVTKSAQTTIMHYVRTGDFGIGDVGYANGIPRKAVVDKKLQQVQTPQGVETGSTITVTILDPTVVIKPMDKIKLPDGTEREVINVGGFFDPDTKKTVISEAYL